MADALPHTGHSPNEDAEKTSDSDPNKEIIGEKRKINPLRAYLRLFGIQYACRTDQLLRLVGIAAALGAGTGFPLMAIIFGNLVNDFNNTAIGSQSPEQFRKRIDTNAMWFVYLFIGKVVVSLKLYDQLEFE